MFQRRGVVSGGGKIQPEQAHFTLLRRVRYLGQLLRDHEIGCQKVLAHKGNGNACRVQGRLDLIKPLVAGWIPLSTQNSSSVSASRR